MEPSQVQKVLTVTPFPIIYHYPATWSTIHNRTHCSYRKPVQKKPASKKKDSSKSGFSMYNCLLKTRKGSPRQEYQLTSQSSNDSVESL